MGFPRRHRGASRLRLRLRLSGPAENLLRGVRHVPLPALLLLPAIPQGQLQSVDSVYTGPGLREVVARAAREAIWGVDGALPVPEMRPMEGALDATLAGPRLNLILMGLFSISALLLAAIGLYGLTAFSVARRTREIGVRLALGAPRHGVLGLVLAHGLKLTAVGTVLGLAGALALTRFLEAILFEVRALDPPTYLGVVVLLGGVTVAAALVPARRALKVNPASSLQAE